MNNNTGFTDDHEKRKVKGKVIYNKTRARARIIIRILPRIVFISHFPRSAQHIVKLCWFFINVKLVSSNEISEETTLRLDANALNKFTHARVPIKHDNTIIFKL